MEQAASFKFQISNVCERARAMAAAIIATRSLGERSSTGASCSQEHDSRLADKRHVSNVMRLTDKCY
jgi:hypothetical protein